ncbi:ABC transporter ATP-binding protein [Erythrobacteraceae bacterium CFH 75059]|nr:ABC transporter ATP-binding protein [Erythrobacteraceae bacterium CFH 75059]
MPGAVPAEDEAPPILQIDGLTKRFAGGALALDNVSLQIRPGEIFALLGPNGAGKTTLIGAVCGLVRPTSGRIQAFGQDARRHWRAMRGRIGLVPQELGFDIFDTVWRQVRYSRGLFGRSPAADLLEEVLRSLSLWDKRDAQIRTLSGGMKRRVLIAKALAHEPDILFLDEPTAGVDVELRRDMWRQIAGLKARGVTIILTTHYLEEAEEMADRIGIMHRGRLLLVDDKRSMMKRLGRTEARFTLIRPLGAVPEPLADLPVELVDGGRVLLYRGGDGAGRGREHVAVLAQRLAEMGERFTAIEQRESSLEDIFMQFVDAEGTRAC